MMMSDCTEYISQAHGDMKCSNCEHFVSHEDGCSGNSMKELSNLPRLKDGNVHVKPAAWCKFYDVDLAKFQGEPTYAANA